MKYVPYVKPIKFLESHNRKCPLCNKKIYSRPDRGNIVGLYIDDYSGEIGCHYCFKPFYYRTRKIPTKSNRDEMKETFSLFERLSVAYIGYKGKHDK